MQNVWVKFGSGIPLYNDPLVNTPKQGGFPRPRPDKTPSGIILFGRSIGTGPTVELALRHPELRGVVLQSPMESCGRVVFGPAASDSRWVDGDLGEGSMGARL